MNDTVIVDGVRTAIGNIGGTLSTVTPDILAEKCIRQLLVRNDKICPEEISEVILGQAKQTCDISNIARVSSLKSGIPIEVPGYTIHRQCGSGLQSINTGALQIMTGNADIIICGGAESMSTAPYYVSGVRFGVKAGNIELKDPNVASQPGSQPYDEYGDLKMGITAENIAEKYGMTREELDSYSLQSQQRAKNAIDNGLFKSEIVPITIKQKKAEIVFDTDEHPRESSMEGLGKLRPAFKDNGLVTAGNSSGRNDGAAALLLMSIDKAKEKGYTTGLKVVSFAASGVDPRYMGLGPIPATRKALEKANLKIEDIDCIELNEAFASQTLAFYKEFNIDVNTTKINPNGGAIALGHPIGATGAILATKLLHQMNRTNAKYGLVTLCIAGGMGIATVFEKINF